MVLTSKPLALLTLKDDDLYRIIEYHCILITTGIDKNQKYKAHMSLDFYINNGDKSYVALTDVMHDGNKTILWTMTKLSLWYTMININPAIRTYNLCGILHYMSLN
ncbi:hypothetical protein J4214_03220 [Candidatus Woesearchaeota archaeon]|nr:hypothetical protein [Candidatus Woesearchaeota archaeon]